MLSNSQLRTAPYRSVPGREGARAHSVPTTHPPYSVGGWLGTKSVLGSRYGQNGDSVPGRDRRRPARRNRPASPSTGRPPCGVRTAEGGSE